MILTMVIKGENQNPVKKIGIIVKPQATGVKDILNSLVQWLSEQGKEVIIDEETAQLGGGHSPHPKSKIPSMVDLIIVLGGDGTLLGVARLAAGFDVPILGANFGGLGFLTEVTLEEIQPILLKIFTNNYVIDERVLLQIQIMRNGKKVAESNALNDIVVSKGTLVRMISLEIRTNGDLITSIRGDGLIVSTPTGSTAYSLSAGGPILHPSVEALLLTPISPQMLTNRPVVIPLSARVEVILKTQEKGPLTIIDGQVGFELFPGDLLEISRGKHRVQLVRSPEKNYYEVLRKKLKWGEG
jgi:NAD+ kinase